MPNRKKERTFPVPMWSLKLNKLVPAGEPVPMDHLSDEDYELINTTLFPEDQDPADARLLSEQRAKNARALETGEEER